MKPELWKRYPSCPRIFVSNCGRVITTKGTRSKTETIPRTIQTTIDMNGYEVAKIDKKTKTVHRLVAETWIPNPDNLSDVDHIDGDRQNNHVENLQWLSHQDNMAKARTNTKYRHPKYIVTNAQTGYSKEFHNLNEVREELRLGASSLTHVLSGSWNEVKGYSIRRIG